MSDMDELFRYRLEQAEETLADARNMLEHGVTPRSVVNRAYYAMFYMTLALFLRYRIQIATSKHSGVIGIFDREFILKGKVDKRYSGMLHGLFDDRQEFDYKDFSAVTESYAREAVAEATQFVEHLRELVRKQRID